MLRKNTLGTTNERDGEDGIAKWEERIAHAARHLDDPIALNASPLTRLRGVERYADSRYKKRICAKGFALRDLLRSSIDCVVEEIAEEEGLLRIHQFLTLFRQGLTIVEISKHLGLSREHVSRVYRKEAFQLVTAKFLHVVHVRGTTRVT